MDGHRRAEIMEHCPEFFKETLKEFIDELEDRVDDIADLLDIKNAGDLAQIEDAHDHAKSLKDSLY